MKADFAVITTATIYRRDGEVQKDVACVLIPGDIVQFAYDIDSSRTAIKRGVITGFHQELLTNRKTGDRMAGHMFSYFPLDEEFRRRGDKQEVDCVEMLRKINVYRDGKGDNTND